MLMFNIFCLLNSHIVYLQTFYKLKCNFFYTIKHFFQHIPKEKNILRKPLEFLKYLLIEYGRPNQSTILEINASNIQYKILFDFFRHSIVHKENTT